MQLNLYNPNFIISKIYLPFLRFSHTGMYANETIRGKNFLMPLATVSQLLYEFITIFQ